MTSRSIRRDFAETNFKEVKALIAWNAIAEPGDRLAKQIVREFGASKALTIFEDTQDFGEEYRSALERWKPRFSKRLADFKIELAQKHDLKLLVPSDPNWPEQLNDLQLHAPLLLWYRGSVELFSKLDRVVAVVGSRNVTHYGQRITNDLVRELVHENAAIISGGAVGVDAIAHQSALSSGGLTLAFMAGSLDNPYPSGNLGLFEQIAHEGLLCSEMSPGSKPTRWRFLQRNRLIAAISQQVVVTEAGWRSGSINTVNHALELNRAVFAIPGPITSPASAGCNRLIRDGMASLLLDVSELRADFNWQEAETSGSALGLLEVRLLDALNRREKPFEELLVETGLAATELKMALGSLNLLGLALAGEGGWKRAR